MATPTSAVGPGDTINVQLSGYAPNTEVVVVICFEWPASGPASCDLGNYGDHTVTTDANGTHTSDYVIQDVIEGGTCDASTPCYIVGGRGVGPPSDTVFYSGMELSFA